MREKCMKRLIKFFVLGLFLSSTCHALTLSQIRTEVRVRIKDTNSYRQRYSDSQLNNMINEAQRDISNKTWVNISSYAITLAINQANYVLPSDLLTIQRVTLNNKNLIETTLQRLDGDNSNSAWLGTTGLPTNYYQEPSYPNQIWFYPYPANASSTGTVNVIYTAASTDLTQDTDIPFNAKDRFTSYHDTLIFYTAFRVYLIEGELDKAKYYRDEYEAAVNVMTARVGMKPNYLPGMSGPATGR